MKRNLLAATAAALAMISAGAQASSTFNLEIRGAGEYGEYGMTPQPNGDPLWPVYWYGSLTVETSSRADGVYTGADLLSIDYSSNYGNTFLFHAGDGLTTEDTDMGQQTYGMEPGASVTIAGGRIVSVDFHYQAEWPGMGSFDGLQSTGSAITMGGQFQWNPHYTDAELSGTVTNVPEPAGAVLLLAGLLVTGTKLRAGRPWLRSPRSGC